jgi:hypothetical protein
MRNPAMPRGLVAFEGYNGDLPIRAMYSDIYRL